MFRIGCNGFVISALGTTVAIMLAIDIFSFTLLGDLDLFVALDYSFTEDWLLSVGRISVIALTMMAVPMLFGLAVGF